jgi:phosphoribosylanthranilate isomerase
VSQLSSHQSVSRVKVCGITSVEDALVAVEAGADAIGLVFYPPSPRYVSTDIAKKISLAVGPFITVVGLFVNESKANIDNILRSVGLHVLQFHGDEPPSFCDAFHRPYMKAIRMKADINIEQVIESYPNASGILLDAYRKGVPGGTGETFDWNRVPVQQSSQQPSTQGLPPIILAGGLTPNNIAAAVATTRPYGVDVSGGVEVSPGKKDPQKVADFIKNAKSIIY